MRLTREILDEVPIGRRPEVLRKLAAYARVHEAGSVHRGLQRFVERAIENPPLLVEGFREAFEARAVRAATHESERMERVLATLVRHCGGIESAYERLARTHRYEGTTVEHEISLGGKTVWTGGWHHVEAGDESGHGLPGLRWREEFSDAWPTDLTKP